MTGRRPLRTPGVIKALFPVNAAAQPMAAAGVGFMPADGGFGGAAGAADEGQPQQQQPAWAEPGQAGGDWAGGDEQ